jgi:hypothetical protein
MQLSHGAARASASFSEAYLVSWAGLVPVLALAGRVGLSGLADQHLSVAGGPGRHADAKVSSVVAGMVAGADSISDLDLLRHGGMGRLLTGARAPSTLGTFPRAFRFGHVRLLDAVASRILTGLVHSAPLLVGAELAYLDVDNTRQSHLRPRQAGRRRVDGQPRRWCSGHAATVLEPCRSLPYGRARIQRELSASTSA